MKQSSCVQLVLTMMLVSQASFGQHLRLDINMEFTGASATPGSSPERNINTNFREDDPFNPLRGKFFPTIQLSKTFGLESQFLFDSKAVKFDHSKNQPFRADGFFLSVKGLFDGRLNFWFGRIPTPVGTFSPRSYSHTNPLIGFPLAYHYKVPYNAFVLSPESGNLYLRDNNFGAATSIYEACWITGLTAFGTIQGMDYMLAAGQGTLTNPEAKSNQGFQIAGRVGHRFAEEFSAGVSGGIAPYLEYSDNLPQGVSVRDPKHLILGVDAAARFDQLHLVGEAFYNSWDTPQYQHEASIQAYTWHLEAQYFFLDNLYAAARVNQMLYSTITDPGSGRLTSWGYDVTRLESGLGFLPYPELNIKAVVQYNNLGNPATREITIIALQAAFHFDNVQTLIGLDPVDRQPY